MTYEKEINIAGQRLFLRDIEKKHRADLLVLHRKIFDSTAQENWFEWKYILGKGDGVGIWNETHEMIAFCGGVPRHFFRNGTAAYFLQIGDLMVSPEWRGILTRNNPFWYACEHFYNTRLGKEHRFQIGFGLTHSRALRLHVKRGMSWDAGGIEHLQWRLNPQKKFSIFKWFGLVQPLNSTDADFESTVNQAWHAMQKSTHSYTIGVRNTDYLSWRFIKRPDKKYQIFSLRQIGSRKLLGIVVLSQPSSPNEAIQWLDWIGPIRYLAHACRAAQFIAANDTVSTSATMTAWASPAVAALLGETNPEFLAPVAQLGILTASELAAEEVPRLRMWLMAGDTEFI